MYCKRCNQDGHYDSQCQAPFVKSQTPNSPLFDKPKVTKRVTASVTKPIMRAPVTQGDGVTRHCPTCTCEHVKVHESPAAKQRAIRERRKADAG